MRIVRDGRGPILGSFLIFGGVALLAIMLDWMLVPWVSVGALIVAVAFFAYFFRDPDRTAPEDPAVIVSGADGVVRAVEPIEEGKHLNVPTIRISVFLNPFDVHVNRAPIGGTVKGLGYTPGKHLLTMSNASSEYNEHSSIVIENESTRCLVKQIVGPVVRRVVYWLTLDQVLGKGDRIGMMKFGSRMDIYLPAADVDVTVKKGDRVRAGETPIATLKQKHV